MSTIKQITTSDVTFNFDLVSERPATDANLCHLILKVATRGRVTEPFDPCVRNQVWRKGPTSRVQKLGAVSA